MPEITVNGISYYYELHGEGKPLVFIAGYGTNHIAWRYIYPAFIDRYRVLIFDNPASGRVLEKLGFHPTGAILPRHSAGRGGSALSKLYCLRLAEDGGCGQWPTLEEPMAA